MQAEKDELLDFVEENGKLIEHQKKQIEEAEAKVKSFDEVNHKLESLLKDLG